LLARLTSEEVLVECEALQDRVTAEVSFHVDAGGSEYTIGRTMVSTTRAKDEGSAGVSLSLQRSKSPEKGSSNGATEVDNRSAMAEHRLVSGASWEGGEG
jgi:hypothetical protein